MTILIECLVLLGGFFAVVGLLAYVIAPSEAHHG